MIFIKISLRNWRNITKKMRKLLKELSQPERLKSRGDLPTRKRIFKIKLIRLKT